MKYILQFEISGLALNKSEGLNLGPDYCWYLKSMQLPITYKLAKVHVYTG